MQAPLMPFFPFSSTRPPRQRKRQFSCSRRDKGGYNVEDGSGEESEARGEGDEERRRGSPLKCPHLAARRTCKQLSTDRRANTFIPCMMAEMMSIMMGLIDQ